MELIPERHRRWVPASSLPGRRRLRRADPWAHRFAAEPGQARRVPRRERLPGAPGTVGGSRRSAATQGIAARIRPYRETAAHFLLGVLLSAYTVFYFKSASFLSSFGFLLAMAGLLVANEWHGFRRHGIAVRTVSFRALPRILRDLRRAHGHRLRRRRAVPARARAVVGGELGLAPGCARPRAQLRRRPKRRPRARSRPSAAAGSRACGSGARCPFSPCTSRSGCVFRADSSPRPAFGSPISASSIRSKSRRGTIS